MISILASLIVLLIRSFIATKMASADTTFTFETDPAFSFETNDKVQIDGRGRHNTIKMRITQLSEMFMTVCPATYLEVLSISMSSKKQSLKNPHL